MVRQPGNASETKKGHPRIAIGLKVFLLAALLLSVALTGEIGRPETGGGMESKEQPASPGEILSNPSFEGIYRGAAPHWKVNAWGNPAPTFSIGPETQSDRVRDRSSAQRFRIDSFGGGTANLVQALKLREGRKYRVSVWLKASETMPVTVLLRQDGGHPWEAYAVETVQVNGTWRQVTIHGSAPADVNGSLRIAPKRPGATLWIDDASLTDVTPASGNDPESFSSRPIPRTYFGMHTNKLGATHNEWPAGNQGILRLWDTSVNWPKLETSNDVWSWQRMDYLVDQAQSNDVDVIYTLGLTPQWAASDATRAGPYVDSSTSAPANLEDWRDYVRTVATRYKGKIKYYEIWNEADYKGFYSGDVNRMVEMSRVAHEELKRIDPDIEVISPGLSDGQGMSWLDEYLFKGGGKYIDIVGYHWKFDLSPEDTTLRVDNVRELMKNHGVGNKPLFNTEGAALKAHGSTPSVDETRGSVARAYVLFWAHGVSNLSWFAWDIYVPYRVSLSNSPQDQTPTAAGVAYRQTVDWLQGARMINLSSSEDGTYVAEIARAGGYRGWIVWNATHSSTFAIPSSWAPTTKRALTGGKTNIAGVTSVGIGPAPILLENEDYSSGARGR